MKQTLQPSTGGTAWIRATFRTLCTAALLLLTAGVFLCALGPSRALRAAAVPEDRTIKSPRSIGSWLDEAFGCVVKMENHADRRDALVAMVEIMDGPLVKKNYARVAAVARGLEPSHYGRSVIYALMQAQARVGMYDEAYDTLKKFEEIYRLRGGLMYIIEQQARAGLYDAALGMAEMFDHDSSKRGATVVVAGIMAEAGKYEDALKLAETIKEDTYRMRALILIGNAYLAAGDVKSSKKVFDAAVKLVRENKRSQENLLCEIAMALCESGLWEDAWGIIQGVKYGSDKNKIIKMIMEGANKAGKFDLSLKVARASTSDKGRAQCLAEVAVAQARAGQRAAAEKAFAEATALYRNAQYIKPEFKANALAALARARGLAGMKEEAAKIFAEAVEIAGKVEPETSRGHYLDIIIKAQTEAGMFDEALETARKFKEAVIRAQLLKTIGQAQAKAGKIAEAEKTAVEVEKAVEETKNDPKEYVYRNAKQYVSHIYLDIARARVAAGDIDKALAYLPKFTDGYYSGRLIIDVAQHYARAGKADEAAKTYRMALEKIYSGAHRHLGGLLADIVKGYVELGMFEQAIGVVRQMDSAYFQIPLMALIGERMAATARIEDVVDRYARIKTANVMSRAWYCIGVARGLAKNKEVKKSD